MIVIYSFWHRISGEGGRLKRFLSVIISMIMLVLISVTVSSAASADFTLRSAQGKPNHIVTLDMVCFFAGSNKVFTSYLSLIGTLTLFTTHI